MRLPKDIVWCSLRLLILIVCICLHNGTTQRKVQRLKLELFKRNVELTWFNSGRVRRSLGHRLCPGNKTTFVYRNNNCFYDHACFKIFFRLLLELPRTMRPAEFESNYRHQKVSVEVYRIWSFAGTKV